MSVTVRKPAEEWKLIGVSGEPPEQEEPEREPVYEVVKADEGPVLATRKLTDYEICKVDSPIEKPKKGVVNGSGRRADSSQRELGGQACCTGQGFQNFHVGVLPRHRTT